MANLEIKKLEESSDLELQVFDSRIQAGFPSPAQGSFADSVDLNHELINNPAATFCARVIGNSMIDSGINEGDMLTIDRSIEPHDGDIAVAIIDKRIVKFDGGPSVVGKGHRAAIDEIAGCNGDKVSDAIKFVFLSEYHVDVKVYSHCSCGSLEEVDAQDGTSFADFVGSVDLL